MKSGVRIVQYNVLSSALSDPKYYTRCDSENLDPQIREDRVRHKLQQEMSKESIICLQEVSLDWVAKFTPFFESMDYGFVVRNYGHSYNGYMGVGIVYPRGVYELVELELIQVGDQIPKPAASEHSDPKFYGLENLIDLKYWFGSILKHMTFGQDSEDHWNMARYKKNTLIIAKFAVIEEDIKEFTVACYHMPCDFRRPTIMMLHLVQVLKLIQKYESVILAGDLNLLPDSPYYHVIRTGKLPKKFVIQGSPTAVTDWFPDDLKSMDSAFVLANGREPYFTNYAYNQRSKKTFTGTLDYIFMSKNGWSQEVNTDPLPNELNPAKVLGASLPNQTEPSDHLLIAVDLTLLS